MIESVELAARTGADRRLRILYIEMAAGAGGSVLGLHRLLQGLDRERYEPVVMLHERQPFWPKFRELGVEIVNLPTPFAKVPKPGAVKASCPTTVQQRNIPGIGLYRSGRFYLWFLRRSLPSAWPIRSTIVGRRIDAVHLNNDVAFNRPAIAGAALAHVPCLAHIRFFYETRYLDRLLSSFISYYIYMSRSLEDYTQERFPGARGRVVYDGLTSDYFAPLSDQMAAREEFGVQPDDFVVGSLGRLLEWKGHKVLLKALAEAAPKVPRLKCLIVGEPDPPTNSGYLEELRRMVASLGLSRVVRFVGFRSEIKGVLSAIDVLVHSSSEPEPFGLVNIEGMAAAKPVIATAAGGVLDIIDDGVTGFLVPINDSSSMASAIVELAEMEPANRRSLGERARSAALERFSLDSYAGGVTKIYEEMLSKLRVCG